jgi:uncharacterized membrane protein
MEFPVFYTLLAYFTLILEIAGSVLIIYGGLRAIIKVIILEIRKGIYRPVIRRELSDKIVFGLTPIAAILNTISTPTQQE